MKSSGNPRLDGLLLLEQARPATESVLRQALRAGLRESAKQELRIREAGRNFRLMGPNAVVSWADSLASAVKIARASGERVEVRPQNDSAWADIQNRYQSDFLIVTRGAIDKRHSPTGRDPWQ